MGRMNHPATGESVRVEEVCEDNPPDYEHDWELETRSWAEIWYRCRVCKAVMGASL